MASNLASGQCGLTTGQRRKLDIADTAGVGGPRQPACAQDPRGRLYRIKRELTATLFRRGQLLIGNRPLLTGRQRLAL